MTQPGTEFLDSLDDGVEEFAVRHRGREPLDSVMYAVSEAANHSLLWHGINLVDAISAGSDKQRRRLALRRTLILGVEQALVNGPIKSLFKRDRPIETPDHPHELRSPLTSSFPSGHASAGFCAAYLLSKDLGAKPLWYGLAAVVSWSRVHVGLHHPSDVLGGVVVGSTLAWVADSAVPRALAGNDRRP